MGLAILLFLVGLRLDLHMIRNTGPVAVVAGLGQVFVTFALGFLISLGLGMDTVTAVYVGVALTFSSTIIIVKLLSDKRELDTLHGRIALGILIVQDIVVVVVMIALTAYGTGGDGGVAAGIAAVALKGVGLLAAVWVLMRFVLPWVMPQIARSQELLVLFGVAYAMSIASFSEWLGFSSEVGAFLAGVSLAGTQFRDALGARLVSLRDFLLFFFFLNLGAGLDLREAEGPITEAVLLSLFVLVAKPVIVIAIMSVMRYPARVGFLVGLPLAQVSEFSLILAALGLTLGHIDNATVSLITVVGLLTIAVSAYMTTYSDSIYERSKRWLSHFERQRQREHVAAGADGDFDVILFGLGRFGSHLAERLTGAGHRVLGVDFDPHGVSTHRRRGVSTAFGSAEDLDLLEALPLDRARYVISAIPSLQTNLALLHGLRQHHFTGAVALTAHTRHDAERLRAAEVDIVLEPFSAAAHSTSNTLHDLLTAGDSGNDDEQNPQPGASR
ncbi:cation:proton antiporter domain-containing protein [Mycobacterium sp. ZZG]